MLPSSKPFRFVLAVEVSLVGMLILVVMGAVGSSKSQFFSDLVQSAIVLLACVCTFAAASRAKGYLRRLWMLLAIGIAITGVALALVTYFKNVAHLSAVTPWPSDILFILWALPVLMMLLPRTVQETGARDWLAVLDFAQVGIVALTAYLYFFYVASVWQAQGHQMVLKLLKLQGYRDMALAAAFFIASRTAASPAVRGLFTRVWIFFLLAVGATIALLSSWHSAVRSATWSDLAWCVPYLFMTVVAAIWREPSSVDAQEPRALFRVTMISQVLPVCIPLVVLLMGRKIAQEQTTIAWAAIAGSFCLSATRLVLTSETQRRIANELSQTEIALLHSSEMFAAAFHSSPDAISISLLPEGRYVTVNESFLRLTGYAKYEVLGKSAAELGLWANDDHRARVLARLGTAAEIKEEEILIKTKSGEIRDAQLSAARVQLVDGTGILGMLRDVTDRRKAEEALRGSESRFRSLVQEMHVGIVLLGPNAEARYINRAALNIFCLNEEQAVGKSPFDLELTAIREDATEIPVTEWPGLRAITAKTPVLNEVVGWQGPGLDGTVWTLVDALPQMNNQGEVTSAILTVSNISERKQAEEALRMSEERFRTLVEGMHAGIILLNPKAEILFANEAALNTFGVSLEDVLGKTSKDLDLTVMREDGTEVPFEQRPGPRVIATGQPVHNEVLGWRLPGSQETIWTLSEMLPQYNKAGKLERVVVAFTDITKVKEAEESLHKLSARLLRLQDEERRRLGRELHDSLAQSVMAVSLDLAQMARASTPLDKKTKHALSQARGVLREMSREIRTLSYLLHPPVLDELGLVSAVKEYAHGFSERSGISVSLEIPPDFARISQEAETALFRIVQESLSNIQRHSGSPTGVIRLRSDQSGVQLEVCDVGCGITGASGNDGSNKKESRLGVGILGMRERMTQLRGTLEVISSPSGTTVKATIPVAFKASDAAPSHPRG